MLQPSCLFGRGAAGAKLWPSHHPRKSAGAGAQNLLLLHDKQPVSGLPLTFLPKLEHPFRRSNCHGIPNSA